MPRTLLAALTALLLLPATASAESESVTSGNVTATLSWTGTADAPQAARLTITRSGAVAFEQAISDVVCNGCPLPGNGADDVKLIDLDGLGEPEAVVTGGDVAGFYSFNELAGSYDALRFETPGGFNLDDLDHDGSTEIVMEDTRFKGSVRPPRIFLFARQDNVPITADITTKFTSRIKRNAAAAKRARVWDTYVADQYLLGHGATGLKELDRHKSKAYRRALLKRLKAYGYR
ncbi:hypothetical protein [Solirubrobacter soli]|uniref:hypothetical protein n=1 Tax=Solirubrobacter soli TaxID=363832 RepID=UPI0003F830A1|nr:hypothetical protein [Solirubrobacter soli]